MGDLFRHQRRQAAAAPSASNSTTPVAPLPPSSFRDIQKEQELQHNEKNNTTGSNNASTSNPKNRTYPSNSSSSNHEKEEDRSEDPPRGGGHHRPQKQQPVSYGRGDARSNNNARHRQQQHQQRDATRNYPLEQGCIASIKDKYGFIRCADRDDQVFFHFSEVQAVRGGGDSPSPPSDNNKNNNNPTMFQIHDEVEFRIGPTPRDTDKLAAYKVRVLPPGTIQWEVPEYGDDRRVQGLVQRRAMQARHNNNNSSHNNGNNTINEVEGTILVRLTSPDASENDDKTTDEKSQTDTTGPLVRFGIDESVRLDPGTDLNATTTTQRGKSGASLKCGDLVEFRVIRKKPSGTLMARDIVLILSERDRIKQETERRLMESAVVEHGIVTILNNEFGFLKSSSRRDKIFFHYSSIDLDEADENVVLKEGQDMKFLVVEEEDNGCGGTNDGRPRSLRFSARQVQVQPRGSVLFYDTITTGVTGTVTQVPQCVDASHLLEQHGKIRLDKPIMATRYTLGEPEPGQAIEVNEVYLATDDAPGGRYSFHGGAAVGLWIEVGDSLLFDIVQDYSDGACRAVPTKHLSPKELVVMMPPLAPEESAVEDETSLVPAVRLIELSLTGRAEGVVGALKDGFGFIQFTERPVDVHFKMYQLLPNTLQNNLRRNMGLSNLDQKGRPLELEIGAQVQFDISLQGTISSHQTGGSRSRNQPHDHVGQERENLKAQRVLILPPESFPLMATWAKGVNGVISKQDSIQPFVGHVELETSLMPRLDVRHRLVYKLISTYLKKIDGFNDEVPPLIYHDVQSLKEDEVVIKLVKAIGNGKLTHSYLNQSTYPGRLCIQKAEKDISLDNDTTAEIVLSDEGEDISNDSPKLLRGKSTKSIRFDKSSLGNTIQKDVPPQLEDVVAVDVYQCRRTGKMVVENMKVVERCAATETVSEAPALGVVKEIIVVNSRFSYGFVSLVDELSSTKELLLFQRKEPTESDETVPNKAVSKVRKGDMVKFDIRVDKSGKRSAVNVMACPKDEHRNKVDKNACRGLVLSQPRNILHKQHAIPKRKATPAPNQKGEKVGRWDSIDGDRSKANPEESSTILGFVLLTQDPAGLFSERSTEISDGDNIEATSKDLERLSIENAGDTPLVQLRYRNGGLALSGPGLSSMGDEATYPRRGDLISFVKAPIKCHGKDGSSSTAAASLASIRDIRIVTREAVALVRGRLINVVGMEVADGSSMNDAVKGSAKFVVEATDNTSNNTYDIDLHNNVVGCDVSDLKENEAVEGILHQGKVYGIARISDLYLDTKLGAGTRSNKTERQKLNLTVKKDLGGKIMAQSMMAAGPDGTTGFAQGWTQRSSRFLISSKPVATVSLKVDAPEFTPASYER